MTKDLERVQSLTHISTVNLNTISGRSDYITEYVMEAEYW